MLRAAALRARHLGLAAAAASTGVCGAALCDDSGEKDPRGPSFDPEALERGAKALREINKSPYAKKVLSASRYDLQETHWMPVLSLSGHRMSCECSKTVAPSILRDNVHAWHSCQW